LKNILTNHHFSLEFLGDLGFAAAYDQGFIDYYCSNWWLLDEAPKDVKDPGSKPCKSSTISMSEHTLAKQYSIIVNGKWDIRKENNPKPGWRKITPPSGKAPDKPGWCIFDVSTGDSSLAGLLLLSPGFASKTDIMLLCENWLEVFQTKGVDIKASQGTTFRPEDKKSLEEFRPQGVFNGNTVGSLAFLIMHEISHSALTFKDIKGRPISSEPPPSFNKRESNP
jgi:hypothetical protein